MVSQIILDVAREAVESSFRSFDDRHELPDMQVKFKLQVYAYSLPIPLWGMVSI